MAPIVQFLRRSVEPVGPCPSYTPGKYTAEDIDLMVADGYIPIASTSEYQLVNAEATTTMGAGTCWEGTYTNSKSGKYVLINSINFGGVDIIQRPLALSGYVFDGNNQPITGLISSMFGDLPDGTIVRNLVVDLNASTAGSSQTTDNFLVRNFYGIVEDCVFTFAISNESVNIAAKGVIADASHPTAIIRRCTVTGTMSCAQQNSGLVVGYGRGTFEDITVNGTLTSTNSAVGGLFGAPLATVTIRNCKVNADITGNGLYIGGLIGGGANVSSGSLIEKSQFIGTVTNNTTGSGITGLFIGGIRHTSSTYRNCFTRGEIITNSNYSGGFISVPLNTPTIENCYAAAEITGTGSLKAGFCLNYSATVNNCYYDSDLFAGGSGQGVAKTTSELQTPTTNSGIYSAWTIPPWDFGTDSEYPELTTTP